MTLIQSRFRFVTAISLASKTVSVSSAFLLFIHAFCGEKHHKAVEVLEVQRRDDGAGIFV